MKTLHFYNTNS